MRPMSKLLNFLTLLGLAFFFYWTVRQFFIRRKLEQQGETPPPQTLRPITLLAIVMVVMYGGYMVYFALSS